MDKVLLSALSLLLALREHNSTILPIEIIVTYLMLKYEITEIMLVKLLNKIGINLVENVFLQSEDYLPTVCSLLTADFKIRVRVKKKYGMEKVAYKKLLLWICDKVLSQIQITERLNLPPYTSAVTIVYVANKTFAHYIGKSSVLTYDLVAEATNLPRSNFSYYVNLISPYCNHQILLTSVKLYPNFEKEIEKRI